jgi:hypothetical protein
VCKTPAVFCNSRCHPNIACNNKEVAIITVL